MITEEKSDGALNISNESEDHTGFKVLAKLFMERKRQMVELSSGLDRYGIFGADTDTDIREQEKIPTSGLSVGMWWLSNICEKRYIDI